jgi:hypothetical protein
MLSIRYGYFNTTKAALHLWHASCRNVLLFRASAQDPYTCQAPGCTYCPLRSKRAAIDHGKKHRAAWGLCRDKGVHLHSGRRPWSKDPSYALWRQEQQNLQPAMKRGAESLEGEHRALVASHQVRRNMESAIIGSKLVMPCLPLCCYVSHRGQLGVASVVLRVRLVLTSLSHPSQAFVSGSSAWQSLAPGASGWRSLGSPRGSSWRAHARRLSRG